MAELTAENIQINHVYSAKNTQKNISGEYNDRMIVWISPDRTQVQYDSSTLRFGRNYPKVSMETFVRWAEGDVTDDTPPRGWRTNRVRMSG